RAAPRGAAARPAANPATAGAEVRRAAHADAADPLHDRPPALGGGVVARRGADRDGALAGEIGVHAGVGAVLAAQPAPARGRRGPGADRRGGADAREGTGGGAEPRADGAAGLGRGQRWPATAAGNR